VLAGLGDDPSKNIKTLNQLSQSLQNYEDLLTANEDKACPKCSDHGSCQEGKDICTCDSDWKGPDCSIASDDF